MSTLPDFFDHKERLKIELNREKFRNADWIAPVYEGLNQDNFSEIYKRLYKVFEHNSKWIHPEPAPKKPEEFDKPISDNDVLDLENCVAMMFTIGLNLFGFTLDALAGRPFIPRDPTTDGSYETAKRKKTKW